MTHKKTKQLKDQTFMVPSTWNGDHIVMMMMFVMSVIDVLDMFVNCVCVMVGFDVIRYMNNNMFMMGSTSFAKRPEHRKRH